MLYTQKKDLEKYKSKLTGVNRYRRLLNPPNEERMEELNPESSVDISFTSHPAETPAIGQITVRPHEYSED